MRFDVAVHALDPGLEVVAPMRVGMGLSRDQEIDYAQERGIEIPITKASPYSIDVNIWGRSCETGVLEDPWVTPPPDAYEWTVAPGDAPAPVEIVLGFEGGIPVSIDGERLGSVELVERLHDLGGAHGVGRIDHVEDRLVGIKSREIYEAPAAVILHTAHHALEGLVLSKEQLRFNRLVADELAQIIYDGLWFSALSRDLRTYAMSSQRVVSGDVRVRLDHGQAVVTGRRSPSEPVRQGPRDVRRGRRLRSRGGGRVHRDLRAAAPRRGRPPRRGRRSTTAPPGRGRSRCSRTCRRRSPKARAPGPADPAASKRAPPPRTRRRDGRSRPFDPHPGGSELRRGIWKRGGSAGVDQDLPGHVVPVLLGPEQSRTGGCRRLSARPAPDAVR